MKNKSLKTERENRTVQREVGWQETLKCAQHEMVSKQKINRWLQHEI